MSVEMRHQPHSARSCLLPRRALGAARGRPRERLLPGCGALGVGRSPTPDCPSLGRAAGVRYPLAAGAGGGSAWGPVTNHTACAFASLLSALWERHKGAPGGASLAWVWGVLSWALTHAPSPVLGACGRGPLPLAALVGGVGVGTHHQPNGACSCELAWRAVGAARGTWGGGLLPG